MNQFDAPPARRQENVIRTNRFRNKAKTLRQENCDSDLASEWNVVLGLLASEQGKKK
jgi:hypothetical protein